MIKKHAKKDIKNGSFFDNNLIISW